MIVTLYYTLPQVALLCGITQQDVKMLSERFWYTRAHVRRGDGVYIGAGESHTNSV